MIDLLVWGRELDCAAQVIMDAECSDWIKLQKYVKITQLLCAHEEADTQKLIAQLKTQVKDYFFHKLSAHPRWHGSAQKQPVLSENSRFVFCSGSHDAHRFLNEFVFTLRNDQLVFKTVLELWPRDSPTFSLAIDSFSELFFEDIVSAENYESGLLSAIGSIIDLNEYLNKESLLLQSTVLGGFLMNYMRRQTIVQYMRSVYEAPLMEVIYNTQMELEIASSKFARNLKSFRVEFLTTASSPRGRISEPLRLPNRLTSSTDVSSVNPFFVSIPEEENGDADPETESVEAVLRDISEKLQSTCLLVLNSLFSKVEEVPYGLRWICKAVFGSCIRSGLTVTHAASLVGSLLFPGWENYIFKVVDIVHISSLSVLCRGNLSIVEATLRSVITNTVSANPDYKYINQFVEEQHGRFLEYLERLIRVPDLQEVEWEVGESLVNDGIYPTPRFSLSSDIRRTLAPDNSFLSDFHFQASVFPLSAVYELLNLVLTHRASFQQGTLEQFLLITEDIARCFQEPGGSYIEAESLKIGEMGVDGEFDCTPFLIFFLDNTDGLVAGKKKSRRISDPPTLIKKVKKALIRLLSAIEQIPTLLASTPLQTMIAQIQAQSYLFQTKKASIQQVMSARTVANYLLAYLPALPEQYQKRDFQELYNDAVNKVKKRRVKSRKYQLLNDLIMLAIRNVEGLLASESHNFRSARGALNELKSRVLELEIPVCINIHDLDDGEVCLTVTLEGFIPSAVKTNGELSKKKLAGSLDPGKAKKRPPQSSYCGKVRDFISHFSHIPQVQNATLTISDIGNVRSCFSSYLELVKEEVRQRIKVEEVSEELLEELIDEVEDHITRQMHGDIFPSWASKEDNSFYSKCRQLVPISPSDFDLSLDLDEETLRKSNQLLEALSTRMAPREKLVLLVEFCALVLSELELGYSIGKNEKPEEAVRVVALAISYFVSNRREAPMLHSTLNYIYKFGTHRKLSLTESVTFSLIKSAMDLIAGKDVRRNSGSFDSDF